MPSTTLTPTPFVYVTTDVPAGQSLLDWRRDRVAAARKPRRFPRLRLRPADLRARLAH
jgi:hypothetical protein